MAAVLIYLKQLFPSTNSTHTNFDILRQKLVCEIWLKSILAFGRYRDHGPPHHSHTNGFDPWVRGFRVLFAHPAKN